MKFLIIGLLLTHLPLHAQSQDKEADLQLPVSDISQIQEQEEKLPPTIQEVEMKQKERVPEKRPVRKKEKIQ